MKAEVVLWRIAIISAVLLLFAPMTPRTSWSFAGGGEMRAAGGGMTHSAGWESVAPLSGIVAIGGLVVGRWLSPRVTGAVLGATIASIVFGIAAAAALGHWLTLMSGTLEYRDATIHPAPAVAYFAGIAAAGAVASLVLLGSWLHTGDVTQG